jgi:tetratricopeptide (TPR) repeat protein
LSSLAREARGDDYFAVALEGWNVFLRQHGADAPDELRAFLHATTGTESKAAQLDPLVALGLLEERANAQWHLGRLPAAQASAEAALAVAEDSRTGRAAKASAARLLARVAAVQGNRQAALRYARQSIAFSGAPEIGLDLLRVAPELTDIVAEEWPLNPR